MHTVAAPASSLAAFARPARRASIARAGWFKREEAIMGTAITVELWADDVVAGHSAIDAVMAEMHRIDRAMSPHKPDSELSRINRDAGRHAVLLSQEMFGLIEASLAFSALSEGAFDISYASAGQLYDYRRGVAPSSQQLARARQAIGWRGLRLDRQAQTLAFAHPEMRIDLGGFAKGHAVDNAVSILSRLGIAHAFVSAGGDSRVIGDKRGRPWTIGVRHPRDARALVAVLPLEDTAVSTSGDYERFFDAGSTRHHHIIDPATGCSPAAVHSVTILAADGLTAEALSKSLFVLGVERGMALIESQPGVDAIVVDAQGRLHYSTGLQAPPGA
ncbi:MAG: FAD:protein FMN transferase [Pseudomonadota bacterium]